MPSWFNSNAFTRHELTESINLLPYVPTFLENMNMFRTRRVFTTNFALEYKEGEVYLVKSQPRSSNQGVEQGDSKRFVVNLPIPHLPTYATIKGDELPDIRAFGTTEGSIGLNEMLQDKLKEMKAALDATREFHRIHCLLGSILDPDDSVLVNLLTQFGGLTLESVDINFTTPENIEKKNNEIIRTMAKQLGGGGAVIREVVALCSDGYYDAVASSDEVRTAYNRPGDGAFLRENKVYGSFSYQGVTYVNYRGDFGTKKFLADNTAIYLPIGPDIYRTVLGPDDTIRANTRIRDIYITRHIESHEVGMQLKAQRNQINFVTRPRAIIKSTGTVA